MYLEKLEIQGFKSFAGKTTLLFEPPKGKKRGITAVVGPNGSGKSNVADSIRWVLGEQSLKLLRSKKSEDVIWHGSERKARTGFAEVSLYLNNEERSADIEYSEVVITRRLYRDGESEYLINKNKVRLTDVQLILAKANFGERHYAIIGQGMIDSILLLSPEERRAFFDEATGVKPFQIKKEQAINKLKTTEENLRQAEGLLSEIEPRMRSLSRAVRRLEDREKVESELHDIQHRYYGHLWMAIEADVETRERKLHSLQISLKEKEAARAAAAKEMEKLEREEVKSEAFLRLQDESRKLMDKRSELREQEFKIKTEIERSKLARELPVPLPLSEIIYGVRDNAKTLDELISALGSAKDFNQVKKVLGRMEELRRAMSALLNRLEEPAKEEKKLGNDKLAHELENVQKTLREAEAQMHHLQKEMEELGAGEHKKKSSFFESQRVLQAASDELTQVQAQINEVKIDLTRLTTRREALEQEMSQELKERAERIKKEAKLSDTPPDDLRPQMQKLKYQLELIGGIDPETIAEHKDTAERHSFLTKETEDLRSSLHSLEQVIEELDALIEKQFAANFSRISDDFGRYFKILFNGGMGKLNRIKQKIDEHSDEVEGGELEEREAEPTSLASRFEEERYLIEISASPPGKRIKGMHMLSGGEKALTAIALVMAIISNQPSPFIVLDEVDAALDESNAIRFAAILDELSTKTQFIVVTHNRYTMERADTLYGVTMGEDGASQLLSVKLSDIAHK